MATENRAERRRADKASRKSERTASASRPRAHVPSPWLPSPGVDGLAHIRNKLRAVAKMRGEWAGIPMPLDGERLIIEPRYPNAQALMDIGEKPEPPHPMDGATERNRWYSMTRRCNIHVIGMPDGRIDWGITPGFHGFDHALTTLGCSDAWGLEQEDNALQLLAGLISERAFRQYSLTGTFIESSKRSGVWYMFRRLRPTVAFVADHRKKNRTRILCTLCLHPIAYYARSWAGAMCPTDDVVAHLMLMRGDERRFWAKSNQHPSWVPQAGL